MRTMQNSIRLRRITCLLRVLTIRFYRTVVSVHRVQTLCTPPQSKSRRFRHVGHDDRVEWRVVVLIRPLSCDCLTLCSGTRGKLRCHSCRTELGDITAVEATLGDLRGDSANRKFRVLVESRDYYFALSNNICDFEYVFLFRNLFLVYHFPITRISRHNRHSLFEDFNFSMREVVFFNGENSSIPCLLHCSYLPSSGLFLFLELSI